MQLNATVPPVLGNWIGREGITTRDEPINYPAPLLSLGHGVFAAPASVLHESSDGHPLLSFILDVWTLLDMQDGRDLPMAYQGTDVRERMTRFAETYAREARHLYGADLALFCESWREATGVGSALTR